MTFDFYQMLLQLEMLESESEYQRCYQAGFSMLPRLEVCASATATYFYREICKGFSGP